MCNVITGQCDCKTAMISGRACDGCGNGYFGFPMCESKLFFIIDSHTITLQLFIRKTKSPQIKTK